MRTIILASARPQTSPAAHPDMPIYGAVLDEALDQRGHITPGPGDAGDRIFGT